MLKNNPLRKGIALIVIVLCVGASIVIGAHENIGKRNNIGQNNDDNYIFLQDVDQQPIFYHDQMHPEYSKPTAPNTKSVNKAPQILWWYDLDAPSFGSAAVNDIDGDGNLEIVFGTYFNDEHIYALNAESGTLLWKYNTGGCNDASPTIADVDLDGDLEVVVPASSPYRVYCFDGATGQVEWSTSTGYPNCIDSPPAVADVDNDDKPEVILGTFYGHVFCLNGEDGSICWQN